VRVAAAGAPHLGYCTNIHPGETWPEVREVLERFVPRVKAALAPSAPFGVGLRLSGRASEQLDAPGEMEALAALLSERGLYVFSINGFPYGTFHATRVKEQVYRPDWLEEERLIYTVRLATQLAALLPDAVEGTVSSVPGAYKPRVQGDTEAQAIAERMIRLAAALEGLRARTGKIVSLAIEPEPCCQLETVAETVSFFEEHLFSRAARARMASLAGVSESDAEAVLHRHLGVCFDACHMAVEYEDVHAALEKLSSAGIRIGKFQISAGLEVPAELPAEEAARALGPFADDVYLHQVVERGPAGLRRWTDLPDALADTSQARARGGDWRIHFHVPLFRERLGPFKSTQGYLAELLGVLTKRAISTQLEVETYTWDVLPEEFRREETTDAIARELSWVLGRLEGGG
jgi:sugar phosphate isomerase/epimerase